MKTIFILLLLLLNLSAFSQLKEPKVLTPEENFLKVRVLASEGAYGQSKILARRILKELPAYMDVSVYLARIYAWETQYDSAFLILNEVLKENPVHPDGLLLKCDILYWKNDWTSLLQAAEQTEEQLPDEPKPPYYKALSLDQLGRRQESMATIEQILTKDTENSEALHLKQQIILNSEKPEVFVQYFSDNFQQPYLRRWHMLTAGGIIPYSKGTVSPYLNAGHLIDGGSTFVQSSAIQLNADAYLLLSEKNYMLFAYGISNGVYFPVHRAMINAWQVFSDGWALSAGARYFYWDEHFLFFNLGVEKYLGNYWFNLNNYIFQKDYGVSFSSYLTIRKYLNNKYNYLSATLGYGTSPDEPLTNVFDLQRLNALTSRISIMHQINGNFRVGAGVGYMYEEYMEQQFRNRFEFRAGLYYKIN